MANQECPIQVVLAGDFIDCTLSRDHGGPHSWQVTGAPETRPEPWTPCGECDRGIRWIPSPMCTCATGPNGEHHPYCGAEPCPNGCFDKLRPGVPVTAPDATQMAHCRDCAHRLGSGCGCECCPWAGEAVRAAAEAISQAELELIRLRGTLESPIDVDEPCDRDEFVARAAVQAALPVVWAAAAAAERAKLQPAIDRVAHLAEAAQAKAVEMAVAAERERCAQFVQQVADNADMGKFLIVPLADAIRDSWQEHIAEYADAAALPVVWAAAEREMQDALRAAAAELEPEGRIGRTLLTGAYPTNANVARAELLRRFADLPLPGGRP